MSHFRVEWLSDSHECETCGVTYSDGAKVWRDGDLVLDMSPAAHCFGGSDYDHEDVFRAVLKALGHTLETEHV